MIGRSFVLSGVLAGLGILVVALAPALLTSWAGSSGSLGDLSGVGLLVIGGTVAVVAALVGGRSMVAALRRTDASPRLGPLDAWGAYVLGLGVYSLVLAVVPAVILVLLLPDEGASFAGRAVQIYLVWGGGHVAAVVLGGMAGRRLLRDG